MDPAAILERVLDRPRVAYVRSGSSTSTAVRRAACSPTAWPSRRCSRSFPIALRHARRRRAARRTTRPSRQQLARRARRRSSRRWPTSSTRRSSRCRTGAAVTSIIGVIGADLDGQPVLRDARRRVRADLRRAARSGTSSGGRRAGSCGSPGSSAVVVGADRRGVAGRGRRRRSSRHGRAFAAIGLRSSTSLPVLVGPRRSCVVARRLPDRAAAARRRGGRSGCPAVVAGLAIVAAQPAVPVRWRRGSSAPPRSPARSRPRSSRSPGCRSRSRRCCTARPGCGSATTGSPRGCRPRRVSPGGSRSAGRTGRWRRVTARS